MSDKNSNQIAPGIFWVGVEDWNRRYFDALIPLPQGTSFNAYLIVGEEKVVLVDTVHKSFQEEFIKKIEKIVNPEKIDYVVMNHAEPDHASTIPRILDTAKNAKLIVTRIGVEMARIFYEVPPERTMIVKDGDTLNLGGKTLKIY